MPEVFGFGVTTKVVIGGERARALYVALADTPEQARQAIQKVVSPGAEVGEVYYELPKETAKRLTLAPGQARRL